MARLNRFPAAVLVTLVVLLSGCASPEDRAAGYLEKARQFYEAGDLVHARVELRNTLQVQPRHARALYLMALVNEREADYPAVLGNLQMAVDADPGYVDAHVKLGNYYAVGRKVAETRAEADAALALAPNSPSVRLLNAWAFYVAGDRARALEEATTTLRLDARRRDAVTLLASLHAEAGRFSEALAVIDEGIRVADESDAESLRRVRVAVLVQAGQAAQAERDLKGLVADFPAVPTYDVALARLFVSRNRMGEAEERIRLLIARDPDNAEWRVQLAGLLVNQRQSGDAEAGLKQAVREHPASGAMRFALADFYETNQRPDEALKVYAAMLAAGPKPDEALVARNRIVALTLRTDEKRARVLVREILADAPANADALVYRAAFSFKDQRLGEAVADLRSALVRQPDSQRALLLLARTYVSQGEAALAEDAYRRLLALNPARAEARGELAAVVSGRGDLKEAETLMRNALEFAPGEQTDLVRVWWPLRATGDSEGIACRELNEDCFGR